MAGSLEWVMLAYRLPRVPSNPRVVIWRSLQRLGAVKLVDGLVLLPADARTKEQFDWLADQVLEAGGEASTWVARASSAAQEREVAARMAEVAAADYRTVVEDALAAAGTPLVSARRTLARLQRELHRIAQRDHFPPLERELARVAVSRLAEHLALEQASSS